MKYLLLSLISLNAFAQNIDLNPGSSINLGSYTIRCEGQAAPVPPEARCGVYVTPYVEQNVCAGLARGSSCVANGKKGECHITGYGIWDQCSCM